MKPVVSSLVALAIAIAPLSAFAAPVHKKATHAKVIKQHAGEKAGDKASDKDDKAEPSSPPAPGAKPKPKSPMVHVKFDHKKHGGATKPAVHHAHNVDLGGAGHKEPKVDGHGAIVPASMTTKIAPSHGKSAHAKPAPKAAELPKLPNPNAGKPSKGGAEKGAKKPTEKKHEAADSSNDGEPTRDEEIADLVARIRGLKSATSGHDEESPGGAHDANDDKKAKPAPHAHPQPLTRTSAQEPAPPCAKEPIEIVRGPEVERFELTKCDGFIAPLAVEHLSIAIRPGGAARPTAPLPELAKKVGPEIASGVHRVDPRLIGRLQAMADHFSKPGAPARLFVISGYRPMSIGSMHSTGRAMDFRVDGARNEDVVAFCKTMSDTGCGFYPNSSFVHLDVRDPGAGHVTWIDASGPGETPRYVGAWPPPPVATRSIERASNTAQLAEEGALLLRAQRPLDRDSAPEPVDEHPAEVAR